MTYRNNAPMSEKHATLLNDRDTRYSRAQSDLSLENSGRHAKPVQADWSTPNRYPFLPASSPWSVEQAHTTLEEPLGEDLSAAPIVGEVSEVNASLGASSNADVPVEGDANRDKFETSPSNPHDELGNPTAKCTSAVPVAQAAAAPSASPFVDVEQAAANPQRNRKRRL